MKDLKVLTLFWRSILSVYAVGCAICESVYLAGNRLLSLLTWSLVLHEKRNLRFSHWRAVCWRIPSHSANTQRSWKNESKQYQMLHPTMKCGQKGRRGRLAWKDSHCAAAHVIITPHRHGFGACLNNGWTGGASQHPLSPPCGCKYSSIEDE